MKILVFSDTHSSLHFMRHAISVLQPRHVIHLGDYYDDGRAVAEEFPTVLFHQVPGNCDRYRMPEPAPETLCYTICGVRFYMTHGHLHNVKYGLSALLQRAEQSGAEIVLYGHTHCRNCRREPEGLWVMNPGCAGSCGEITIEDGKIISCKLWTEGDF